MYTISRQLDNSETVVSELLETVQNLNGALDIYLDQIGNTEVLIPAQNNIESGPVQINESISPQFFETLGIRSMALRASHGRLAFPSASQIEFDRKTPLQYRWRKIKNELNIEDFKMLLRNSQIISFEDWANLSGAADLWDGILFDVIRSLDKKDFDFIFYLGDITKRRANEVDEILDIISDYSFYGRVTLMLDENEATKLWAILYDLDPDISFSDIKSIGLRQKYLSTFDSLGIDQLLIYAGNQMLLLSGQKQFELVGREIPKGRTPHAMRSNFNAGYSLGLLLGLDISLCVALAKSITETFAENGTRPDRKALLAYIKNWNDELKNEEQEKSVINQPSLFY